MRYLVVGPTIINDIIYTDGTMSKGQLGGAVFCQAGIKLWCDSCLYISHVGSDFETWFGAWMDANECAREGLQINLPHTFYTVLRYGEQGLFSEECIYGSEEEALVEKLDRPDARFIASHCDINTRGIYIEATEEDAFWNELSLIREKGNIRIMWEIPTDIAMDTARRGKVLETIKKAGLFSINLPEALCLFQAENEEEAIAKILELDVPCYLRVGAKGSYFLCNGKSYFAPSVTVGPIVDPTGCGNCSTAAALYGICEGYSPSEAAMIGNISAAYNLLQHGPYPRVNDEVRRQAKSLLKNKQNF